MKASIKTYSSSDLETPDRTLSGDLNQDIIHEFIRQLFQDEEISVPGFGGTTISRTRRIVIEFES
jgi:hypothetical protein